MPSNTTAPGAAKAIEPVEVQFAYKTYRMLADGSIEAERLMNARTGETEWFPVPTPTKALLQAFAKRRR